MRLAGLELVDFRSWEHLRLELPAGRVALVGPNATGKTSILEAAWYAASLGSHRASADAVLVRVGKTSGIVRVTVEHDARSDLLELEVVTQGRARARLAGAPVPRRRDMLGTLRAALFAPERLAVVRGDPSERRRFSDELLVQLHPRHHAAIREFERALRQRNTLLRESEGREPAGLEAWDEAVAGPGGQLCAARADAIARLAPAASAAYGAVGGDAELRVSYAANVAPPDDPTPEGWAAAIRVCLAERRRDELARGTTLAGPHRDDLEVSIGGMPARTHASQGEAWLAAIGLVLGAHAAIAELLGHAPVLLLDDAFSVLDPARRERLSDALPREAHVIATTSDRGEVPAGWTIGEVTRVGVTFGA